MTDIAVDLTKIHRASASDLKHKFPDLKLFTWDELAAMPEPIDLIPGLIKPGLNTLVGRPNSAKTTLAGQEVAALLMNRPVLGRLPESSPHVDGHRVLWLTTDQGTQVRVKQRLEARHEVDADVARHNLLVSYRLKLDTDQKAADLCDLVREFDPSLVVIDNLKGIGPAGLDIKESGPMGDVLDRIKDIADICPVELIHHTAKTHNEGSTKQTDGAGATVFDADSRNRKSLTMPQGEKHVDRTLVVLPNEGQAWEEDLHLTDGGLVLGHTAALAKAEKKRSQEAEKVAEAVASANVVLHHASELEDAARQINPDTGEVTAKRVAYTDVARILKREQPNDPRWSQPDINSTATHVKRHLCASKGSGSRLLILTEEGKVRPGLDHPNGQV